MSEKKKQDTNKNKKIDIKIKGLDVDKAEYQEIVLSNSNRPEQNQYRF